MNKPAPEVNSKGGRPSARRQAYLRDKERMDALLAWMRSYNITYANTARQLGWNDVAAYYALAVSCTPQRREALLALGFPAELLPPDRKSKRAEPHFPGLEKKLATTE